MLGSKNALRNELPATCGRCVTDRSGSMSLYRVPCLLLHRNRVDMK